jgi:hypothetical protein
MVNRPCKWNKQVEHMWLFIKLITGNNITDSMNGNSKYHSDTTL